MADQEKWTPKSLYRFWNSRYFRNRLPDIPVVFSKQLGVGKERQTLGLSRFDDITGQPLGIRLNPRYKNAFVIWAQTLLHEMVHIQQWRIQKDQAHGNKFNRRMKQLAQVGAFRSLW